MPRNIQQSQIENSLKLAKELQANRVKTDTNSFANRMAPIIQSPKSKHFLIRLMDVAFRSKNYLKVSGYVMRLFKRNEGYSAIFSTYEKVMVRLFRIIGHKLPSISIPIMLGQIKDITSPIVFLFGSKKFKEHSKSRYQQQVKLNVNLIGESLIGEKEAAERIKSYSELLQLPEVNYISIKISTIYSQINSLAHEHTVDTLVEKLSTLYQLVLDIEKESGEQKFINLDMEEFRDLHLTIDTFKRTLDLPQFLNLRAGIVLQAYLPDSYEELIELQRWSQTRVKKGGAPIKIRIVKGANMEMEKTEASLEDWPLAPYSTKVDTDANYKKMLLASLDDKNLVHTNIGVASHNVFDIAFALDIILEYDLTPYVDFEMLEGMANSTVDELLKKRVNVLLYTPIVKEENYMSAIAYLVRRLDEGTQDGNFLKEGFNLKVDSDQWNKIKTQYLDSINKMETVSETTNRIQNRSTDQYQTQTKFHNVANTDWTIKNNRQWIKACIQKWETPEKFLDHIPVVQSSKPVEERESISQESWNGTLPWKYELSNKSDYDSFLDEKSSWYELPNKDKANLLRKAAIKIDAARADLICVAITELGKTIQEVDVEVSEAVDFANYYASQLLEHDISNSSSGVNLILSPWNFPIAIPIGGVLASLASNNRVILKPSQNAAACAFQISKCLWEAGIPKDAFAFLPTKEEILDNYLSDGDTFSAVILTGGTETAKFLLNRNPRLNLFAETGGKNATIITSLSDREQAIKNIVQSAFGNTGQKCSATSLLILEEEVYNDPTFKSLLKDAIESKTVGNPWSLETQIGPLAVPISDKLLKSIEETPDEQWLIKPKVNGLFKMSPGVKWAVSQDDFEYNNELFGPILSVIKVKDLKEAVSIVNNVDYGLTSGIETLDEDEINYWINNIEAGNLYVNRSTTGAIVQRQPFGGMKASCFGFGMKAGGPNYLLQFAPESKTYLYDNLTIKDGFGKMYQEYFIKEVDYSKIRGQHNINRYLKPNKVLITIGESTSKQDLTIVTTALKIADISYSIYTTSKLNLDYYEDYNIISNWRDLKPMLNNRIVIRSLNYDALDDDFLKYCHSQAFHIYDRKPSSNPRIEFLNYLTEQNISINYHRYGNLLGEQPL